MLRNIARTPRQSTVVFDGTYDITAQFLREPRKIVHLERRRVCFNAAEHDMTMIKLIHPVVDIAIICSNFEESLRFYHEILGLEIVFEIHISDELAQNVGLAPQGFRQVRLKAGDTLIKLADIASPPPPLSGEFSSGVNWLTLFVEDIEQTIEELKRNGVELLAEPFSALDAAGVVCARDPDGLLIEFVQPRQK